MNSIIDNTEEISRRVKELQAERDEYLKGTSAPVDGQEPKTEAGWKSVPGYTLYGDYDPA